MKSTFAWHVIQFMRPSDPNNKDFLTTLRGTLNDAAAFRKAAINTSENADAKDGGDMGWVAADQLSDTLDTAIFATAVGSVSGVITVNDGTTEDGDYLLMVLAEETRTPTEAQLKIFKDTGFSDWYTAQKGDAEITYDIVSSSGAS